MKNLELVKRIREIIEKETSLEKNADGTYTGEIYVDYRDMYIEDKDTLAELSEKGEDAVYDYIMDCSVECDVYEYSGIEETVKGRFTKDELEEYEDEIGDFIRDNIDFVLPEEFVWGSEVLVNIIITAYEDWNYEFTKNEIWRDDDDKMRLCDGGIMWLIQQQGYSVEEFENEINTENVPFTNNLFDSIYNEILNTTTSLNALVISTKMTLRELIDLKKSHENKTLKSLKIDKSCDVGLVDFWQGAGSVLDIKLEKDLEIPLENIYEICSDSSYHYNIGNIYGHDSYSYWTDVKYSVVEA